MGKIVAIDLFSGAGGTTSGLKKSGINVQVAIENKRKVSGRKIYLDDKLEKYIWKNEINVQKIAV